MKTQNITTLFYDAKKILVNTNFNDYDFIKIEDFNKPSFAYPWRNRYAVYDNINFSKPNIFANRNDSIKLKNIKIVEFEQIKIFIDKFDIIQKIELSLMGCEKQSINSFIEIVKELSDDFSKENLKEEYFNYSYQISYSYIQDDINIEIIYLQDSSIERKFTIIYFV